MDDQPFVYKLLNDQLPTSDARREETLTGVTSQPTILGIYP